MANKKNSSALSGYFSHLSETFFLKFNIADRQNFVNNQNVWLKMSCHCESEAYVHAARVALYWRINKSLYFSKSNNGIEHTINLLFAHAEQGSVEVDILPTREFWMEACSHLKK